MRKLATILAAVAIVTGPMAAPSAATDEGADEQVFMTSFQYCGIPLCAPPLMEPLTPVNHELTVTVGETVEWVFADWQCYPLDVVFGAVFVGEPIFCYHDVSAADGSFQSPKMAIDPDTGEFTDVTFSHTFTEPGRFDYACSLHGFDVDGTPFMTGTVFVEEVSTT